MRLSAGLISVAAWTLHATGHGAMQFPKARNVLSSHYCPQCANGPSVCGSGGDSQWPADDSGASKLNGDYTTPLTQLYAGGLVEVEVFITAAHLGHFAVELCANPGSKITEDCFVKLERDPTDTRFSPYIDSSPWAAPFPDNSCATTFTQGSPMKVRFKVPSGVVSDHAVIRWYWQTGNSCAALPETTSGKTPSSVTKWSATINGRKCSVKTSSASSCGSKCPHAGCANEQFKNCADVKILAASGSNQVVTSSNYQTGGNGGNSGGSGGNGGNSGGSNVGGSGENGGNNVEGNGGNNGGSNVGGSGGNSGGSNIGGSGGNGGNSGSNRSSNRSGSDSDSDSDSSD
eukprot:Protomagalhaensia_wolfi_Nauph_80__543@NODE_1307_length_1595_cov_1196_195373_g1010_i0_p1_GENE_NODE_1307_length_1595_cov_1196_195373_g1010_i0NODE_1307_length_1595_cov_1196_195373_g1010_i0_p1_ORF_typecomplete_len345_score54_10LPMO_10/PF03067_15/5e20_NODE_1307_length_1595_cov_1196_195373_g1010_i03791413